MRRKKFTVPTEQVGDFTELSTDRVQEVDISERVDSVSEVKSADKENVEDSIAEEKKPEVDTHVVQVRGTSDASEVQEKTESEETPNISETVEKSDETEQVKQIVSEDEDTLWEKFKTRREWKVPNSGIVHHEYVEEEKKK